MSDEWQQIQNWLTGLGYANYIAIFEENGYDDWDIIKDLTSDELIGENIKKGHAKKILKRVPNRSNLSFSNSNRTLSVPSKTISSDQALFDSLQSRQEKLKAKYSKYLQENKFIHSKPSHLHPKCKEAYYAPRKTTKTLSAENKIYNEKILQINNEADLNNKYWDSSKVKMEAKFRSRIEQRIQQIDASLKSIDLNKDISSIYRVRKDSNTQKNINKKAKDLINDTELLLKATIDINAILNEIQCHLINKLKIINSAGQALTVKARSGYWSVKLVDKIKDEKILRHYNDLMSKLNKRMKQLQQCITKISEHSLYSDISKRSKKKLSVNDNARMRMALKKQNVKYTKRTAENKQMMKMNCFQFLRNTEIQWNKNRKIKYNNTTQNNICKYLYNKDVVQLKLSCQTLNMFCLFVYEIPFKILLINGNRQKSKYYIGMFSGEKYNSKKKLHLKSNQYILQDTSDSIALKKQQHQYESTKVTSFVHALNRYRLTKVDDAIIRKVINIIKEYKLVTKREKCIKFTILFHDYDKQNQNMSQEQKIKATKLIISHNNSLLG